MMLPASPHKTFLQNENYFCSAENIKTMKRNPIDCMEEEHNE